MKTHFKAVVGNQWLVFAIRLLLGGCFLFASLSKLQNPDYFIATVISYGVLPDNLAKIYGLLLPWVELAVGCALILGIYSLYASWLSILMALSFAVAGVYSLMYYARADCGCFGQLLPFNTRAALVIDIVLILLSIEILAHSSKAVFFSVESLLHKYVAALTRNNIASMIVSKIAIVAIAVIIVVVFVPAQSTSSTELDKDINDVLDSGKYALLFFYAKECPSCKAIRPAIEAIEYDFSDNISVLNINYDSAYQDVRKFTVIGTPTILIITGKTERGEYIVFQRFDGITDSEELRNSLSTITRR